MFVSLFFKSGTTKHYADVSTFQLRRGDTNVDNYGTATHVLVIGSEISNRRDSKIVPVSRTYSLADVSCITCRNEKSSAVVLHNPQQHKTLGDLDDPVR